MDEPMGGWIEVNGPMDGWMDQLTNGRMDGKMGIRIDEEQDGGMVTFIGVVESGGVDGADTGGLGLATLVSNGLRVATLILAVVKILR